MEGLDFWIMLLKIVVFLPFILFLVYLSLKYGGNKLQHMQNGRYIKVLERVPLSKENSLLVIKLGEKGYVVSSAAGKVEKLLEIDEDELNKIETSKNIVEYTDLKQYYRKLFKKKED
jgi:flagellar protein FliO/FliZ